MGDRLTGDMGFQLVRALEQHPYDGAETEVCHLLANSGSLSVSELCLEFGVGRKCGHKWLVRHAEQEEAAVSD